MRTELMTFAFVLLVPVLGSAAEIPMDTTCWKLSPRMDVIQWTPNTDPHGWDEVVWLVTRGTETSRAVTQSKLKWLQGQMGVMAMTMDPFSTAFTTLSLTWPKAVTEPGQWKLFIYVAHSSSPVLTDEGVVEPIACPE